MSRYCKHGIDPRNCYECPTNNMNLEQFKKEFDEKLANTTDEELYDFFAGYEEDDDLTDPYHLQSLIRQWREMAEQCDSEILRCLEVPTTLIMSDYEKVRYQQAAISYRFCADSLENLLNG